MSATVGEIWYAETAMRVGNHPVEVLWDDQQFPAARVLKAGRDWCWARLGRVGVIWLPDWPHASPRPAGWRPLPGRVYPGELPAPLPHFAERMVRLDRLAFDAATAAAEMEADRETARAHARTLARTQARLDDEADRALPWWRNPALVTYSQPGAITPREAEGRVMRALYFLGGGGLRRPGWGRMNSEIMAEFARATEFDDARRRAAGEIDAHHADVPRLPVHATDTDARLLAAMRWVSEWAASRDEAHPLLLIGRSRNQPWTFQEIAEHAGLGDRRRAHEAYRRALVMLARIANTGTPTVDALLADVQERNRSHARTR